MRRPTTRVTQCPSVRPSRGKYSPLYQHNEGDPNQLELNVAHTLHLESDSSSAQAPSFLEPGHTDKDVGVARKRRTLLEQVL